MLTDFKEFLAEVNRDDFSYVVPDFRLNKAFDRLNTLSGEQKDKVEFLCNECCYIGCNDRKACYENVSRKNLGKNVRNIIAMRPMRRWGIFFKGNEESKLYRYK